MTFAIGLGCVDIHDRSCIAVCPVDCIYEGDRKLYIQPEECIDCGACLIECPVSAIFRVEDTDDPELLEFAADNLAFFAEVLPGREEPLGSPGDAARMGRIGVDTHLISCTARREET